MSVDPFRAECQDAFEVAEEFLAAVVGALTGGLLPWFESVAVSRSAIEGDAGGAGPGAGSDCDFRFSDGGLLHAEAPRRMKLSQLYQ
jgi:hypothetical protein